MLISSQSFLKFSYLEMPWLFTLRSRTRTKMLTKLKSKFGNSIHWDNWEKLANRKIPVCKIDAKCMVYIYIFVHGSSPQGMISRAFEKGGSGFIGTCSSLSYHDLFLSRDASNVQTRAYYLYQLSSPTLSIHFYYYVFSFIFFFAALFFELAPLGSFIRYSISLCGIRRHSPLAFPSIY